LPKIRPMISTTMMPPRPRPPPRPKRMPPPPESCTTLSLRRDFFHNMAVSARHRAHMRAADVNRGVGAPQPLRSRRCNRSRSQSFRMHAHAPCYARAMPFSADALRLSHRFRGFLPVVVDVETGGFDCDRHALLELAAVTVRMDADGFLHPDPPVSTHVEAFPGSELDPRSLEITGIDPGHPLRGALPEKDALEVIFKPVRAAMRANDCTRAILVGHNASFDLGFLNA